VVESFSYPDGHGYSETAGQSAPYASNFHHKKRLHGGVVEAATGLYDFRNRWMVPETGAWMSRDPLGDIDSSNLYQAWMANPVLARDPDGLMVICGRVNMREYQDICEISWILNPRNLCLSKCRKQFCSTLFFCKYKDILNWAELAIGLPYPNPTSLERAIGEVVVKWFRGLVNQSKYCDCITGALLLGVKCMDDCAGFRQRSTGPTSQAGGAK
jgi:RHS repeat-associated protein